MAVSVEIRFVLNDSGVALPPAAGMDRCRDFVIDYQLEFGDAGRMGAVGGPPFMLGVSVVKALPHRTGC